MCITITGIYFTSITVTGIIVTGTTFTGITYKKYYKMAGVIHT